MGDETRREQRQMLAAWREGLAVDELCSSASEWAAKFRYLTHGETAHPGPWNPNYAPYLNAIMDAGSVEHPCRRVVVKGSNQIGKSSALTNIIGYRIHQWPVPIMIVIPRNKDVGKYTASKLDKMIENTPVLRARIGATETEARGTDQINRKTFPGGQLVIAGSRSEATYAADPYGMVCLDDLQAFEANPGGDHVELAEARTRTFANQARKLIIVSTPKEAGAGIDIEYENSSQNQYWLPCLGCGAEQVLERRYFRIPAGNPEAAHFVCQHCGRVIPQEDRAEMVALGTWRARRPELSGIVEGFLMCAAIAPFERWGNLGRRWLEANAHLRDKNSDEKLRTCKNLDWGESFIPADEIRLDEHEKAAFARREPVFVEAQLAIKVKTCGVDVQANRLEASLWGWGAQQESWWLEHRVVKGGYEHDETWDALFDWMLAVGIRSVCIDAGNWPDFVHDQIMRRGPELLRAGILIYGVHGKHGPGALWPKYVEPGNVKDRRTQTVMIRVDAGKDWILGSLQRILEPGPGYIHLDQKVTKPLIKGLLSERERNSTDPRSSAKYVKRHGRERNEPLDCAVYGRAALFALATLDASVRASVLGIAAPQSDGTASAGGNPAPGPRRGSRRRRRIGRSVL